jgi:hypothetical protein
MPLTERTVESRDATIIHFADYRDKIRNHREANFAADVKWPAGALLPPKTCAYEG